MAKEENKHLIENANIKEYISIPGLNDKIDFAVPIVGNGMQIYCFAKKRLMMPLSNGESLMQY